MSQAETFDRGAASCPAVQASSDRLYASPRPLMRDGYLVRSNKAVAFLRSVDRVIRLCVSTRRVVVAPEPPKRILVSIWAHLGDLITSLATIRALREAFPSAQIDLLVGSGSELVLADSSLYDHLYKVDHFVLNRSSEGRIAKLRTYLGHRRRFLRQARARKYEIAIDLYPYFPPASPLFWQAGIPVRCGFTSGGFGPLLTHPVKWSFQDKFIGQYGKDLITKLWPRLAGSINRLRPFYPYDPRAEAAAPGVPAKGTYVVVHMGAGQIWKEWPEENWCDLVKLWDDDAPKLVFCGTGARERERAKRVAGCVEGRDSAILTDTTWSDFVALVANAAGLICLDSSASHVAAAFSVPTVVISSGANEPRLWGPDNENAIVVTAPTGCAPCHRTGCEAMACVRNVTPAEVLGTFRAVMKSKHA